MRESVVFEKAFKFAVCTIKVYKRLNNENREFILSKQFLRSATSIGANIKEALNAQSKKDFLAKIYVAFKEAGETEYWIDLLVQTNYLYEEEGAKLKEDIIEISKILNAIIKTSKKNSSITEGF